MPASAVGRVSAVQSPVHAGWPFRRPARRWAGFRPPQTRTSRFFPALEQRASSSFPHPPPLPGNGNAAADLFQRLGKVPTPVFKRLQTAGRLFFFLYVEEEFRLGIMCLTRQTDRQAGGQGNRKRTPSGHRALAAFPSEETAVLSQSLWLTPEARSSGARAPLGSVEHKGDVCEQHR